MSGWLLVLFLILTVWNPASLSIRLASTVANLPPQTTGGLMFLAARLVITSIGVAAGLALVRRRAWAVAMTKVTLVLFAIEAVARLSTRIGLSEAPPGTRLPLAAFIVAHNGAWYLYLQKSARVRALYGLESQRSKE